jgi:hypothetical protein
MTPLWTNEMANPQTDTRVYPADFLPQLQQALGTLANLQIRYEIERDYLEDWSGPAEVKDRLLVELNQCHAANRGGLVSCLAQLQREAQEAFSPAAAQDRAPWMDWHPGPFPSDQQHR